MGMIPPLSAKCGCTARELLALVPMYVLGNIHMPVQW